MAKETSKIVTFEDLAKYTREVIMPEMDERMDNRLLKFADEVILPAVGQMFTDFKTEFKAEIGEMLDERLTPIERELVNIRKDVDWLKDKVKQLIKMENEDVAALGQDILMLKKKVKELEMRLKAAGA